MRETIVYAFGGGGFGEIWRQVGRFYRYNSLLGAWVAILAGFCVNVCLLRGFNE